MTLLLLSLAFALAAAIYATAGFGGGSTYTALLSSTAMPLASVPVVSLICNSIVSAGGVWHFRRAGHLDWRLAAPLLLGSMPAAAIGGAIVLDPHVFRVLLGFALLAASVALALGGPQTSAQPLTESALQAAARPGHRPRSVVLVVLGALLGALAGLVGIGGGIFLAPALLVLEWAPPQKVAALAATFIFFNAIAGLLGQLSKAAAIAELTTYLPLALAVFVGGQVGSRMGARKVSALTLRRVTAVIVAAAAVRLLWIAFSDPSSG